MFKKSIVSGLSMRVLHVLARYLPGEKKLRPALQRLRGVYVGENVSIGEKVYIENEYPERIEIHENTKILSYSTFLAHTRGAGKIIIQKNVYIGYNCIVVCPPNKTLTIGEFSVISHNSLITRNISPYSYVSPPLSQPSAKIVTPPSEDTPHDEFINSLVPIKPD